MDKLNNLKLWWYFFLYTFCISAFVQIILLPYAFPSLYAGNGLLNSPLDSTAFHTTAVDLADKIRTHGWSAWQLRPYGQSPIGIASIIYFFILPDSRILIPFNAALHATAAMILVSLLNLLIKNKIKAVICVLPFLIFPSTLQWTMQLHRDGISILGILLILYPTVLLSRTDSYNVPHWFFNIIYLIVFYILGFILTWVVRPYLLAIIRPFLELSFFLICLGFLVKGLKKETPWQKIAVVSVSMLSILFILSQAKTYLCAADFNEYNAKLNPEKSSVSEKITESAVEKKVSTAAPVQKPAIDIIAKKDQAKSQEADRQKTDKQEVDKQKIGEHKTDTLKVRARELTDEPYVERYWKRSPWLPLFIETKVYYLALARGGFRFTAPEAKSNMDSNIGFTGIKDVLAYLPRAVQISFLAPFPNQWLCEGSYPLNSLMRRISAFEMIVIYFALLFLPYAIWYWRKRAEIWITFLFCTYNMLILGLVVCNVGTLYRMRYVYITTLAALGIAGFIVLLDRLKARKERFK